MASSAAGRRPGEDGRVVEQVIEQVFERWQAEASRSTRWRARCGPADVCLTPEIGSVASVLRQSLGATETRSSGAHAVRAPRG